MTLSAESILESTLGTARTRLITLDDYVSLDTETTGYDIYMCEVIEVAAIRYRDGIEVARFSSLMKPDELPIPPEVSETTGITDEMLSAAPLPNEVIPRLAEFIGDDALLGHNICFDVNFLDNYFEDELGRSIGNTLVDTMRICQHIFDRKRLRLPILLNRCSEDSDTPFSEPGKAHRSEYDAAATAYCYEVMKPLLIDRYGENPEDGYKKSRAGNKTRQEINYGGIAPTVDEIDDSNPFYGCTICFTGALSHMIRREAVQRAVNLGAIPEKGVTKKLDYLVVGSTEYCASLHGEPSGKQQKAEKYASQGLPIQVISESLFYEYAKDAI